MANVPTSRALLLRKRYGLTGPPTDDDLRAICAGEGLTLVDAPELVGRVKEVVIQDCLCLATGLCRRERRWLIAHGLGHWMLHEPGGHFYVRDERLARGKRELQAELFAGWLLCADANGAPPFGHLRCEGVTGLADWVDVPYAAVNRWIAMLLAEPGSLLHRSLGAGLEEADAYAPSRWNYA